MEQDMWLKNKACSIKYIFSTSSSLLCQLNSYAWIGCKIPKLTRNGTKLLKKTLNYIFY